MKFLLIIIALLGIQNTYAKNYYFSSASGDDNRSSTLAQNPATPWKTLTKLNAIFSTLTPGDNIFFNRGETFFGSITVNKSGTLSAPITLSAYGAGANPEITGFTSVSNWYSLGNGIWETYAPSLGAQVNMLTISGTEYAMGRYPNNDAPNKGYLNYESHVTNTSITDYQLSSYPNWTGAEVVIRNQRSVLDRALVTAHSGNTLYYNSSVTWDANDGYGYFFQNDIRTLDKYGEWSYNASSKKLDVYFGTGGPAADTRASVVNTLVTSKYQSHIVFDNLTFTGSSVRTFDIYYATNIQIKNCSILFSGTDAIIAADARALRFENNTIAYTNNIGIDLEYACDNSIIRNNKIQNTGIFPGMGAHAVKGSGNNSAFRALTVTNSPNTLIEYNEIENTGYVPISFEGNRITIKNNFINNFTIIKDDGGGIYTHNMNPGAPDNYGRKLIGNIILNAVGAQEGTDDFINTAAHGIYMDYNAGGVEVTDNTIANCSEAGFYNDVCHDVSVVNNTLYNNESQVKMLQFGTVLVRNLVFQNNIMFSKLASQPASVFSSDKYDISTFGVFDNNYYARPLAEDFVIKAKQGNTLDYQYNYLTYWKSIYNHDWNSKGSPVQIAPYTLNGLVGANKVPNYQHTFQNSLYVPIGNLDASKQYILKFTSNSSVEATLTFRFLQNHSPYSPSVAARQFKVTAGKKDHEYLVSFPATDPDMGLIIESSITTPFTIDNLQFIEANVTLTNPDDYFRFEYNASQSNKTVALDGTYIDVKNVTYSNSVVLAPYTSIVLIRKPGTTVTIPSPPPGSCSATGTILREQWNNVNGKYTSDIPLQYAPSSSSQLTSLEAMNLGNGYGARIRGYICAPQTGNYTFWIAGDDAAELHISTDDNPNNKTKIADLNSFSDVREWNKFSSQKSAQIYLETGKRYYIEVLHKEDGGNDHVSIAWQLPNGAIEAPIPGSRLSPYVDQISSTFRTTNNTISEQQTRSGSATTNIFGSQGNGLTIVNSETQLAAYPSPFKTVATVQFYPVETGLANLGLFDIQGKKVRSLFSGNAEAGVARTITLRSDGLSSGTYILRLATTTKTISKKIVLSK